MNHLERLKVSVANGEMVFIREHLTRKDVFETFKDGRTLLHIASLNGRSDVVEFLVNHGSIVSAKDVNGYTPLHLASAQGHFEVVSILLEAAAEVDEQDQYGNASVHTAAWNGFSRSLELLRQHHANVNISNRVGFTPLHTASQRGHNQCARVLIYGHANIEAKNRYGETPLHTSTRHGHAGVARILISAKAKVNAKNKDGDSCLHLAASLKRNKIARLLLDADAKKSLKNKNGETPLDVARKYVSDDIATMLENHKEKKKKSLLDFLRRKSTNPSSAISQSSTASTLRDQTQSLVPSLPSSKGSGRHLEDFLSTDSFEDVPPETSVPPFHSLDRLATNRKKRDQHRSHPTGQPSHFSPPPRGGAYDAFDHRINCGDYMNFWYPSGGQVGAHGSCQASGYPSRNGFYPGYDAQYCPPLQYPTDFRFARNFPPAGLTNTIEQSMQYYRDLAGNLKQGPAPTSTNQERDQHIDLLGPGDFHFDLDTNEFIQRNNHLYEPIETLDRRRRHSAERDDWLRNEMADTRRNGGRPMREPLPSNNNNNNLLPLEPNVIVRNNRNDINRRQTNHIPMTPYHLHDDRQGWDDNGHRVQALSRAHHQPPIRRCLSDETISTVLGSSHARRRASSRRQPRTTNRPRNERGIAPRTSNQASEVTNPRATHDRNQSAENSRTANNRTRHEMPRGVSNEEMNRNRQRDRTYAVPNNRTQANSAMRTAAGDTINRSQSSEQPLRNDDENITNNLSMYLDEDYPSSDCSDGDLENETNRCLDSLPSSEDERDVDPSHLDDVLSDQYETFVLDHLSASPRRGRGNPVQQNDSEECEHATGRPPVETGRGEEDGIYDHPQEFGILDSSLTNGVEALHLRPPALNPRNLRPSFGASLRKRRVANAGVQLEGSSHDNNHVTSV